MKTIFKKGDKVYDYQFGWGRVSEIGTSSCPVLVFFTHNYTRYTENGAVSKISNPTLSFTEYTLEGFSQERPINYEDYIGKWGKFWDDGYEKFWVIRKLKDYKEDRSQTENGSWYDNFKPLTEEQIKILEL